MNYTDREKLNNLREVFDRNYKVTKFYADYLNICPEFITEKMIALLTEDGDIGVREAIVALLCELFGLDSARSAEERRLIKEYLNPSVRMLDAKKYTENPYYKNVAPKAKTLGAWEIKWEYYPPYRAAVCDDMIMREDFSEVAPLGYFTEGFYFPAVLEDGNEWMTLSPVDVDTCDEAIDEAHGKVVTFGLGLGYYAYMVSNKPEVKSITVVEKSPEVIRLFTEEILPRFENKEKVKIVNADAFEYAEKVMSCEKFDYAFVDTWRDASDGAPMYQRMKKLEHLSKNTKFSYWIERFLISRLRAERFEELWQAVEKEGENAPKSYREFIEKLEKI